MKTELKLPSEIWKLLQSELGANFEKSRPLAGQILAMHHRFTTNRSNLKSNYLEKKEEALAYLAYYFPLNILKFLQIFKKHHFQKWIIQQLKANPEISLLDYGCGPGTATVAFLWFLREKKLFPQVPLKIILHDIQKEVLSETKVRIELFAKMIGVKVKINCIDKFSDIPEITFGLFGNTINELIDGREIVQSWNKIISIGLFLEPSHRVSSQKLIRHRGRLLEIGNARIIGPCMHLEKCPLIKTDNWCHFSYPIVDPRWNQFNRFVFKSPRNWLKYSYLLVEKNNHPNLDHYKNIFRAIGDLHPVGGKKPTVRMKHGMGSTPYAKNLAIDLCMPEKKWAFQLRTENQKWNNNLFRGDLIKINKTKILEVLKSEPAGPSFQKNQRSRDRIKNEPEE